LTDFQSAFNDIGYLLLSMIINDEVHLNLHDYNDYDDDDDDDDESY